MTKNISDDELTNVSGAGDDTRKAGLTPEIGDSAEPGSGPGGPGQTPDTAATGNDPADLDRQ